jgi:hypothetical protein
VRCLQLAISRQIHSSNTLPHKSKGTAATIRDAKELIILGLLGYEAGTGRERHTPTVPDPPKPILKV